MLNNIINSNNGMINEIVIKPIDNSSTMSFLLTTKDNVLTLEYKKGDKEIEIVDMINKTIFNGINCITFNSSFIRELNNINPIKGVNNVIINDEYVLRIEEMYLISLAFPDLKVLSVSSCDKNIIHLYKSLSFIIKTEPALQNKIESSNKLINGRSEMELIKPPYVTIDKDITVDNIKELFKNVLQIDTIYFNGNLKIDYICSVLDMYPNVKINKVRIECENENIDNIKLLKKYKNIDIKMIYDRQITCSVDDFITMRYSINYYLSLIPKDLSNLEKIMYVYDLIKSFPYKEVNNDESLATSREIHSVVTSGKIVCVGYSLFMKQLLKELGIKSSEELVCTNATNAFYKANPKRKDHMRSLVRVDDDKYQIHGIYSMDATWDSMDENDTSMDSYDYFLKAFSEYDEVFQSNSYPYIYSFYKGLKTPYTDSFINDYNDYNLDNRAVRSYIELFDSLDINVFNNYMNARVITTEEINNAKNIVRSYQGFTSGGKTK